MVEPTRDIIGYDVLDRNGNRIGEVDALWVDDTTGRPEFVAVKTGWIFGRHHLVPIQNADVEPGRNALRVPYEEDRVKDAPTFPTDHDLRPAEEARVYAHYGVQPVGAPPPGGVQAPREGIAAEEREGVEMPLYGERTEVGTETVETGGVRLRKVVRTETDREPVELRREEIHVERVGPDEVRETAGEVAGRPFEEQDIEMRTREERPVVHKEREVIGGVRAEKEVTRDREDVQTTTRREDVEVERIGETPERGPLGETREREE